MKKNSITFFTNVTFLVTCSLFFSGCSSVGELFKTESIDYKTSGKQNKRENPLAVPPDLKQPNENINMSQGAMEIPASNKKIRGDDKIILTKEDLPLDIKVERLGNKRWLVVSEKPENIWPQIKSFWEDAGFIIDYDRQDIGIIETNWLESKPDIPKNLVGRVVGKVFKNFISTGEKDKFRTRLENIKANKTEIFITHRRFSQIITGRTRDEVTWTKKPSDPELEAEFLARLMSKLTKFQLSDTKIKVNETKLKLDVSNIKEDSTGTYILLKDDFPKSWRRVGVVIDRLGFSVEDRDRSEGIYYVRYVEPKLISKKKGFLSKLFGSNEEKNLPVIYQITIKSEEASSQVRIFDVKGKPIKDKSTLKILNLLDEQLN